MPTSEQRVDLEVPFREKDQAKAMGARWDPTRKVWYAPPATELGPLARWMPPEAQVVTDERDQDPETPGVALSVLVNRVRQAVQRAIPESEWVRAEITEIQWRDAGWALIKLAEHDGEGRLVAQASARLWSSEAATVTRKFRSATGGTLEQGMKVLLLAAVDFHRIYGLQLTIRDIDPVYTLGDLEAKRRWIRETLKAEALFELNCRRPLPGDFTRVAVLTPESAAGLGDFQPEAALVERHGLCRFAYYTATFQGENTHASVTAAFERIRDDYCNDPFDAVIVLRGGGSAVDLAWLDDVAIARCVCNCPVAVITGIGHERDSTILDEVARARFDTPSKVAAHIVRQITDNAQAALQHYDAIRQHVRARVSDVRQDLHTHRSTIATAAAAIVRDGHRRLRTEQGAAVADARRLPSDAIRELRACWSEIEACGQRELHTARVELDQRQRDVARTARVLPSKAQRQLAHARATIRERAEAPMRDLRGAIGQHVRGIRHDAHALFARARVRLTDEHERVGENARHSVRTARRDLHERFWLVVNVGPQATLQRGFALVRDPAGAVVTDAATAGKQARLRLEFRDGRVAVQPIPQPEDDDDGRKC